MLERNRLLETLFALPKDCWSTLTKTKKVGRVLLVGSFYSHMLADSGVALSVFDSFYKNSPQIAIDYVCNIYFPLHVYFTFPALIASYLILRHTSKK